MTQHVTFEHALSKAFAHIGAAVDIFQSLPRPNGATTAALSNGNGKGHMKALSPQKVKKAAVKALPAAPAAAEATVLAKAPKAAKATKKVKAKAAAKAKPAKAVAKAKPAKAAKAAKAIVKAKPAKAAKTGTASAIAEGRRAVASGERPKLHDAVAIVMGSETLTAGVILERLKERGWEPGASNPQSYISYTLSDNAETFKRHKRGEYSVLKPKSFEKIATQFKSAGGKSSGKAERVASTDTGEAQAPATSEPVQAAAEAAPEASAVAGDPPTSTPSATAVAAPTKTDEALADLGLGASAIGKNPFDA